jgi:hypothetical protein
MVFDISLRKSVFNGLASMPLSAAATKNECPGLLTASFTEDASICSPERLCEGGSAESDDRPCPISR